MIFAYHSLGPNDKITLDSLVPQALGSASLNLIPNGNEEIFNVSCSKLFKKCHIIILNNSTFLSLQQMKQKKCGKMEL